MNEQDKPAFAALIISAAEIHSKKISTALLNLYWKLLKKYDFADVVRAVEAHLSNPKGGEFMVKPANISNYIEGDWETRALQALSKVESAVRHIGSYTSVAFDDPIIHTVIEDMGGWVKFCSCKGEEIPFQANQFMKRYQGYLSRERLTHYPSYLIGSVERSHHYYGFKCKELPVLVGDKNKAKKIMQKSGGGNLLFHREEKTLDLIHDNSLESLSHVENEDDNKEA